MQTRQRATSRNSSNTEAASSTRPTALSMSPVLLSATAKSRRAWGTLGWALSSSRRVVNASDLSHPMHLHGHSFQVIDINGRALNGALRDTVLVTPGTSVTVAFDANNPGLWYLHCHVLWHLAAGMATLVQYDA